MPHRRGAVVLTSIGLSACLGNLAGDAERTWTSRDMRSRFVVAAAQGVVMAPHQVADLLRSCGRTVPSGLSGYWAPDARTLADLEDRLPALLDAEVPLRERPRYDRVSIVRQYAGVIRHGRRLVYVNAWRDHGSQDLAWRQTVTLVCDGGPLNFGVLYDPVTRTFSDFAGNGPL